MKLPQQDSVNNRPQDPAYRPAAHSEANARLPEMASHNTIKQPVPEATREPGSVQTSVNKQIVNPSSSSDTNATDGSATREPAEMARRLAQANRQEQGEANPHQRPSTEQNQDQQYHEEEAEEDNEQEEGGESFRPDNRGHYQHYQQQYQRQQYNNYQRPQRFGQEQDPYQQSYDQSLAKRAPETYYNRQSGYGDNQQSGQGGRGYSGGGGGGYNSGRDQTAYRQNGYGRPQQGYQQHQAYGNNAGRQSYQQPGPRYGQGFQQRQGQW